MKSELVLRGVETVDGNRVLVTVDLRDVPGVTGEETDEDLLAMIAQILEGDPRIMCARNAEIMLRSESLLAVFSSIAA